MKAALKKYLISCTLLIFFSSFSHDEQTLITLNDETISALENSIYSTITRNCSFSIGQIAEFNIPFTITNATNLNSNVSNITPTTNAITSNLIPSQGINNTTSTVANGTIFANSLVSVTNPPGPRILSGPPGLYCLAPNFPAQATNTAQTIGKTPVRSGTGITINASYVIIDFNDTTLMGFGGSTGILINNGVSNVIIRNGTIANMTTAGITINNGNNENNGAIIVENMRFINNGTAINVQGGSNVVLKNCSVYFSTGNGISLSQTQNSCITQCISNNNNNHGITMSNSNALLFLNCQANNNSQNGFNANVLADTYFENCNALQNTNGFSLAGAQCIDFLNCGADQNTNAGFIIAGATINCANCISCNNTTGFSATGPTFSFNESIAKANSANGFQITGNYAVITNSESSSNGGQGYQINGIGDSLIDSFAKNNGLNGILITGTGLEICSCYTQNNGTNGITINGYNHAILNCISSQNNQGSGINTGNGILLANSGFGPIATACQVRNNTTTGNNTGINNQGTLNRIYANFSNNNTTNYSNVTNVAISPLSTDSINFITNISE